MAEENEKAAPSGENASSGQSSDPVEVSQPAADSPVVAAKQEDNASNTDTAETVEASKEPLGDVRFTDVSLSRKGSNDPAATNISEAEGQEKKLPYPKSVFFIISNEFCERFNYYGMRTILVLYLSYQLNYSDDTATVIFHVFTMFVYFLCVLGAIISDSWLGKFKTILYLSLVYVCGSILVALGAMPPLNLPAVTFTMIGLSLIALGSGGIKPCVSAFGGDQFKLPEQTAQITTFFSLFYFAINAGSLISTSVTPILREDVHCFGEKECYSLAFGVPAVLMAVSIVIFILGRPLYKSKPPAGNMVLLVSKTIGNAIATKWREKKTNPREHWLDYADQKYEKSLIEDVKVLMRVLVLYLPLPVFWALFDQQGSRWTFQATRMDGDMGSWDIKPDQLQVLNPLLILVFIPLYDVALYPALRYVGIRRPLQKLTMGGILAGVAFIISGMVELELEKTYPVLPSHLSSQMRVFNGDSCAYRFTTNLPTLPTFDVPSMGYYENKHIPISTGQYAMTYSVAVTSGTNCITAASGLSYTMTDNAAHSLFIASKNSTSSLQWYLDEVNKPSRGKPVARALTNVPSGKDIVWKSAKKGTIEYIEKAYEHNLTEFNSGSYKVFVDEVQVTELAMKTGGVYTIVINEVSDTVYIVNEIEVAEPNSMSILWLIPQYVVMTLGEVMFSVTGLEFSYSQAPTSMKSVIQACWLLTVAFGNVIVVIIAELSLFDSQAYEFFLFAGLMFVDMVLFMFMAYRYVPNDPNKPSELEPLTGEKGDDTPARLEGIDNKTLELDEK